MIIPLIRRTNNIVNAAVCVRGGTIPPKKGIVNRDSSGIEPPILVARFPKTGIVYRGSSGIVCCVCAVQQRPPESTTTIWPSIMVV